MVIKIVSHIVAALVGFILAAGLIKRETTVSPQEVKTLTKTLIQEKPAQIVYKDKVREIKLECPTKTVTIENHHEAKQSPLSLKTFHPTLKLSVFSNSLDVNKIEIGAGYFLTDRLSIDLQTNIKFDTIKLGVSAYF